MTRPTVCLDAPAAWSLASSRGRTVSEDDVPTMISSSSRIIRITRRMLKPHSRHTRPSTPNTNTAQVPPERDREQAEVGQGAAAEHRDRVGHAAERADRGGPHDDLDDAEDHAARDLES